VRRLDHSTRLGAILLATALAAYLATLAAIAYGQEPDAALLLARTCVSERSWRTDTSDCAAIYEVALARSTSRGTTLARALRDLSPRLHGTGPIPRPWLRDLQPDGDRHRHWPRGASWARRRPEWLATYQEALDLVAGSTGRLCASPPVSWGSSADLARGRARGRVWDGVDCGRTLNHFGRWR
jgi:hypothetical protein